jgi:hypothetical protein
MDAMKCICDILINGYEHFTSLDEFVDAIVSCFDLKNKDLREKSTAMAKAWQDEENVKFSMFYGKKPGFLSGQESEKRLKKFITKYLGEYL